MSDLRLRAGRFLRSPRILVLLAPFFLLAPVWLTGKALYWGTVSTQFIPWWQQAWITLQGGELPLWNPLLGAGAPLLANYQSALLYPPTWFYFLLNALGGVKWMAWGAAPLVAAHLAWAGLGMVVLARRLGASPLAQSVAGLAFGLSGYLVARSHFLSINAAVAWLPWILWGVQRLIANPSKGRLLALAGLLALQWLAGHAQVAAYTLLLALLWAAFWLWQEADHSKRRRAAGWLVGAGGLALALAAAQLLPTLEYLLHSQRAGDVGRELALNYSFWPWRLLGLLAPNLFGNPAWGDFSAPGNYWEEAIYVGLLPLLLALGTLLAARQAGPGRRLRGFLAGVGGIAILLALGRYTPLYPWLYEHVPGFRLFQAPARWSLWLVLALALLAALALDGWRRPVGRALYWSRLAVAGAAAIILVALGGLLLPADTQLAFPDSFLWASLHLGLAALALALLNLRAPETGQPRNPLWTWAVALLVAADLLWAGWGLNPGVETDFYAQAAAARPESGAQLDGGRLYLPAADEERLKFEHLFSFERFAIQGGPAALAESLLPNLTVLAGISSANNFDPFVPAGYQAYMQALNRQSGELDRDLLAGLAVSQLQRVAEDGAITFEALDALGRARWQGCIELDGQILGDCDGETVGARIVNEGANHIAIEVQAPEAGWLVLADSHYPGWQARVDGVRAEIQAADGLFRAVEISAGAHQVEFVYRPRSFSLGLLLSLGGWLAALSLWRRRAPR